jgi:hypothetical protein
MSNKMDIPLIEVYRDELIPGKAYYTTTYTYKSGSYTNKNERYFTSNELIYVGHFTHFIRGGYCGGDFDFWDVFDNDGKEVKIEHNDDYTTSYISVEEYCKYKI